MAQKSETTSLTTWLPTTLAAAAVGAFAIFGPSPRLTSQRPPGTDKTPDSLIGDQRFPARLWEDPFDSTVAAQLPTNSLTEVQKQVADYLAGPGTNVTLLGIFVEGSNYPEDRETRLRLRYAAQWALLQPPWRAADRAHLGCFEVHWFPGRELQASNSIPPLGPFPGSGTSSPRGPSEWSHDRKQARKDTSAPFRGSDTNSLRVPFEWFHHYNRGTNDGSVLVLWLNEDAFADFPVRRLLQLHAALNELTHHGHNPDASGPVPFRVIGPRSSDTLGKMAQEENQNLFVERPWPTKQLRATLEIHSPYATAPDVFLGAPPAGGTPTNRTDMAGKLVASVGGFTNLTVLDAEMVAALANELGRRRVPPFADPSPQDGHVLPSVALLFEGDTLFSKSLVNCFAAVCNATNRPGTKHYSYTSVFANCQPLLKADALGLIGPGAGDRSNANYVAYAYLRGLDGSQGGGGPKTAKDQAEATQENAAVSTRYNQEPAEGNAQFDYARRISRELKERVPELKAVGIFGSDPYDKVVLLQALRQEFPDAIYFTRDLDNRYLGPKAGSATRNMIVVSPFPLDFDTLVRPEVVRQANFSGLAYTEFRSYAQTALYCSVRRALGDQWIDPWKDGPLLYEVGRSRFIPLPDNDYREPVTRLVSQHWLAALLLLACGGWLLVLLVPPLRRALRKLFHRAAEPPSSWRERVEAIESRRMRRLAAVGVPGLLSVAGCWLLFLWQSAQPDGEPFRWNEGVSIWPTELARLAIIWLVFLIAVYGWYWHRIWRVKLWAEFVEGVDLSKPDAARRLGKKAAAVDADLVKKSIRGRFRQLWRLDRNRLARQQARELCRLCGLGDDWLSRQRAYCWLIKRRLHRGCRVILRQQAREIDRALGKMLRYSRWRTLTRPFRVGSGLLMGARLVNWKAHDDGPSDPKVGSRKLLQDYFDYGRLWKRMLRVVPATILFLVVGFSLMALQGPSTPLTRSRSGYHWDWLMLRGSVVAFCFLVFFVVDSTRLTERLLRGLGEAQSKWEPEYLFTLWQKMPLQDEHLVWYADVQFAAEHTEEGYLIYMPFIVLSIMLLSRTQFFDRWPWRPSLLIIVTLCAAINFLCALSVRRAADKLRKTALERLEEARLKAQAEQPPDSRYADLLQQAIDKTSQVSDGAYAHPLKDKAFLAVLLSSGGAGLLKLLDYLFSSS